LPCIRSVGQETNREQRIIVVGVGLPAPKAVSVIARRSFDQRSNLQKVDGLLRSPAYCGVARNDIRVIKKMDKYKIYLEVDRKGCCMAHIRELPGCFVWDRTQKKVLERVPEIIKGYLSFLKKNGEKNVSVPKKIKYEVLETQRGTCPVKSGNKAALFSYDLLPPAKTFINQCIRWMGYNRKELLKRVGKLSGEILDWKPEKKVRSIRETLNHVANCDLWYLSRLQDFKELYAVPEYPKEKIFEKLKENRELAIKILRNLSPEDRNKINVPRKWAKYKNEKWTAGKMLRRFLEHEREHIGTIDKTLGKYRESIA